MCSDHASQTDEGLFPPLPEEVERLLEGFAAGAVPDDLYTAMLESQCGVTDDSQPVEQYDGTLGVTRAFVDAHQPMVGQLQWNNDLAAIYTNPGNVAGVRWCTGALIGDNLFLTAGHCLDRTADGWQLPRVNGSNDVISSQEIATRMHVNFNFQVDPNGNQRPEQAFAVTQMIEHRLGTLDFAPTRSRSSATQPANRSGSRPAPSRRSPATGSPTATSTPLGGTRAPRSGCHRLGRSSGCTPTVAARRPGAPTPGCGSAASCPRRPRSRP